MGYLVKHHVFARMADQFQNMPEFSNRKPQRHHEGKQTQGFVQRTQIEAFVHLSDFFFEHRIFQRIFLEP